MRNAVHNDTKSIKTLVSTMNTVIPHATTPRELVQESALLKRPSFSSTDAPGFPWSGEAVARAATRGAFGPRMKVQAAEPGRG